VSEQPKYIRLPKGKELCRYSGLRRSKLYSLISPTKANNFTTVVESVSLRQPGTKRGTRLIVLQSLLDYIHGEVEKFQESIRKEAPSE